MQARCVQSIQPHGPVLALLEQDLAVGSQATHHRRVPTGMENLEVMLGGGVLASSSTTLLGFSDGGETMLMLHFGLDALGEQQLDAAQRNNVRRVGIDGTELAPDQTRASEILRNEIRIRRPPGS